MRACKYAQKAPRTGSWQTEGLTEGLTQTRAVSMQPLRLLALLASTTLVGIWSSCFAAACNTPYSARFSPRCIAHRARSARIPFQGRLVVMPTVGLRQPKIPPRKKERLPLPFQNASHRKVCICLPLREKAFRCERISAVCRYFIGRRDGAANGRRNEQQHEY